MENIAPLPKKNPVYALPPRGRGGKNITSPLFALEALLGCTWVLLKGTFAPLPKKIRRPWKGGGENGKSITSPQFCLRRSSWMCALKRNLCPPPEEKSGIRPPRRRGGENGTSITSPLLCLGKPFLQKNIKQQ